MKVHKTKKTVSGNTVFLTLTSHKNREFCFFRLLMIVFPKIIQRIWRIKIKFLSLHTEIIRSYLMQNDSLVLL